ncbi:hypothetical protein AB6A40_002319 [Gnathostoma spinigerum]|uniref:Methyltransferase FkbM domain-containing protein n=1 Tax=Gnathostoma spinigerum TaxID=75299 RepID=A0ABD6E7D6_9BILA
MFFSNTARSYGGFWFIVAAVFTVYMFAMVTIPSANKPTENAPISTNNIARNDHLLAGVAVYGLYFRCLRKHSSNLTPVQVWNKILTFLPQCEKEYAMLEALHMKKYPNLDETKYGLIPQNLKPVDECNIITLGIGRDTKSEEAMKADLPSNCHFFGADPIPDQNENLYTKVGTYFPLAIGAKDGISKADILGLNGSNSYQSIDINHVNILKFLREHVKMVKYIDNLLMDSEHSEYGMAPLFHRNGELDKAGYVVCQWNCEFHDPSTEEKRIFGEFFLRIVEERRYVPLNLVSATHIRLFFLNIEDPVCVRRYMMHMITDS